MRLVALCFSTPATQWLALDSCLEMLVRSSGAAVVAPRAVGSTVWHLQPVLQPYLLPYPHFPQSPPVRLERRSTASSFVQVALWIESLKMALAGSAASCSLVELVQLVLGTVAAEIAVWVLGVVSRR